jgi:hypothetical protein
MPGTRPEHLIDELLDRIERGAKSCTIPPVTIAARLLGIVLSHADGQDDALSCARTELGVYAYALQTLPLEVPHDEDEDEAA